VLLGVFYFRLSKRSFIMFELNETMLVYLGLIVSVLVYAVNYLQRKSGKKVAPKVMGVLMYAIAFVVTLLFGAFALPALPSWPVFPDEPAAFMGIVISFAGMVLTYGGELLALLTAIVGAAWVPYQFIYKKVFEGIKPLPELPADSQ
jgi:NADH:ubiquinone oxidoreductase subunit 4 (subunit M)